MRQYDIWLASLPCNDAESSVMKGTRPVLVVSNDKANQHSPVVTVVPLTSKLKKALPTHVVMKLPHLTKVSTALCEQLITLDKSRFIKKLGFLSNDRDITELKRAIQVQLNFYSDDIEGDMLK